MHQSPSYIIFIIISHEARSRKRIGPGSRSRTRWTAREASVAIYHRALCPRTSLSQTSPWSLRCVRRERLLSSMPSSRSFTRKASSGDETRDRRDQRELVSVAGAANLGSLGRFPFPFRFVLVRTLPRRRSSGLCGQKEREREAL